MRLSSLLAVLCLISCAKAVDDAAEVVKQKYAVISGNNGLKYHTGLLKSDDSMKGFGEAHVTFNDDQCDNLPAEFDLRTIGVVSDVRDQGQCGSCWAHSMTEGLESSRRAAGFTSLKLSVQELVSNDKSNWGCSGGLMQPAKSYQVNHGQGLDSDFPYRAADVAAKNIAVAQKAVAWEFVGGANKIPTVKDVKCALFKRKSTPWVTVSASNAWGSPPSSEATAYRSCSNGQTNHAVTIVGWNKLGWIMMNSWSKAWGANGFMTIPFSSKGDAGQMASCDRFGEEVAFVSVEQAPSPTPTPVPPSPTPPGPTPPGPTPGPCTQAPKVRQAAEVQAIGGTEVALGVKSEAGVSYTWTLEGKVVGSDSMLYVTPEKDSVYKLSAKNACAVAESQVRVRLVFSEAK